LGQVSPARGGIANKDGDVFWITGVLEFWKKLKPEVQFE